MKTGPSGRNQHIPDVAGIDFQGGGLLFTDV